LVACFSYQELSVAEAAIDGREVELQELSKHSDLQEIKGLFRISDEELDIDQSLTSAVCSRIALKDI